MSAGLQVTDPGRLTQDKRTEIDESIEKIIAQHKGNRQEINRLVFESVAAMTAAENSSQELASKSGLKRFLGGITGSNKRLQDDINSNRAIAQYTSQQTLQRLAEQNLMSFDLITAVNNKLNASVVAIEEEFNEVYRILGTFFKQTRSDLIQLENRVERLERNVNLLNWQNSIEYQMFNGIEYPDLDLYTKIVCLVRDFYDITKGQWTTSDLLLLKTAMTSVGLSPKETVNLFDIIKKIAYTSVLKEHLLHGKMITRMPDAYLIPFTGIKKLQVLEEEERYVVETVISTLQENGIQKASGQLCEELTCSYLRNESSVNVHTEVNCYDLIIELLFNLDSAENMRILQSEEEIEDDILESKEDTEDIISESDMADMEEKFAQAAELFKQARLKEAEPLLQELSDRGYVRANALLYWIYDEDVLNRDYFHLGSNIEYKNLTEENIERSVTGCMKKAREYAYQGFLAGDVVCSAQYSLFLKNFGINKRADEIFLENLPKLEDLIQGGDVFAKYIRALCYRSFLPNRDYNQGLSMLRMLHQNDFYKASCSLLGCSELKASEKKALADQIMKKFPEYDIRIKVIYASEIMGSEYTSDFHSFNTVIDIVEKCENCDEVKKYLADVYYKFYLHCKIFYDGWRTQDLHKRVEANLKYIERNYNLPSI